MHVRNNPRNIQNCKTFNNHTDLLLQHIILRYLQELFSAEEEQDFLFPFLLARKEFGPVKKYIKIRYTQAYNYARRLWCCSDYMHTIKATLPITFSNEHGYIATRQILKNHNYTNIVKEHVRLINCR